MTATAAERVRAARLRKKATMTEDERAWLASYEAAHPRARRAPSTPTATPTSTLPTASSAPPEESAYRILDFGDPATAPSTSMTHAACTIPDCPKCKMRASMLVCGTTGELVAPRMTEDGARGLAAAILGACSFIARLFGRHVSPQADEVRALGRAIREAAYRRSAAWASSYDDVLAVAFVLGTFAMRAASAPKESRR